MNTGGQKITVTVWIGGEEYTIRSEAAPDYARDCAAYVDRTLAQVAPQGSLLEPHKAVILAALSLADQIFQLRAEKETLKRELGRLAGDLAAEIDARLAASGLASSR